MMIVANYVGPSSIEGVGIFAAAPIKAGQVIWVLEERFDLTFTADEVALLPNLQRDFIDRCGYHHMTETNVIVLEYDNGRFMNHSDEPNTNFCDPQTGYAIRDIAEGEELTCDYSEFDPNYEMQGGRHFVSS